MENLTTEVLLKNHDRDSFDCGVTSLNDFLKRYAIQNERKSLSRIYVCSSGNQIIGYYSLAFGSVMQEHIPSTHTRGLGRYEIPSMILGRLAIDIKFQGEGFGMSLLKDAMMKAIKASAIAGLKLMIVHAKDQNAQNFYLKHGFISFLDDPLMLFFPLESI